LIRVAAQRLRLKHDEDLISEFDSLESARITSHERDQPTLREQRIWKPGISIAGAKRSCDLYNAFLPFVLREPGERQPNAEAAAVSETVESIHRLFQETREQLRDKHRQLAQQVNAFAEASIKRPGSYEHGNLLGELHGRCTDRKLANELSALTRDQLYTATDNICVENADHFGQYVLRILPEALHTEPT